VSLAKITPRVGYRTRKAVCMLGCNLYHLFLFRRRLSFVRSLFLLSGIRRREMDGTEWLARACVLAARRALCSCRLTLGLRGSLDLALRSLTLCRLIISLFAEPAR
jgi:hypothetical protein